MSAPVYRLEKSGGRVVIAQFSSFRGADYLDLRLWVTKGGELKPTEKGVTVPLEAVRPLGEALARATRPAPPETP